MLENHNIGISVQQPGLTKKSRAGRYNLKKLLDRNRFSPRLLRFSRSTKSVDCENPNEQIHSFRMLESFNGDPTVSPDSSTVLASAHQKLFIVPTVDGSEHVVEEEYEESPNEVTDPSTEALKSQRPDTLGSAVLHSACQIVVPVNESVPSEAFGCHSPRLVNVPSPAPNSFPKGDLTPPVDFTSSRTFCLLDRLECEQSIYNEPCDAKPIFDAGPSAGTIANTANFSENLLNQRSLAVNSPSSLSSDTSDSTSSVNKTPLIQANIPTGRSLKSDSKFKQNYLQCTTTTSSTTTTPNVDKATPLNRQTSAGDQSEKHCQLNPGFVDAPRGNSVIVHHSTSAFARVPRGVSPDNMLQSPKIQTTPSPGSSTRFTPQNSVHLQQSAVTHHPYGSRVQTEANATYEEAWDLKMTRQLGFGIHRLPVTQPASKNVSGIRPPVGSVVPTLPTVPRAELLSRRSPQSRKSLRGSNHRVLVSHTEATAPNKVSGSRVRVTGSSKGSITDMSPHENHIPDNKMPEGSCQPKIKPVNPMESTAEYDYAYNGSWSLGVQLNMKLAINESSSSSVLPCDPKPLMASQSSMICHAGQPVQNNVASKTRHLVNIPFDSDNLSTDSFDDSWDARHQKIISDLTRSRIVDASTIPPNADLGSQTTSHCIPLHLRPLPELSHPATSKISTVSNKGSSRPVSINRASQLSTNLESLPLEEQPWYHPSLTRSEAEGLLHNEPEGTFLVRNSETCLNDYSLTIKHKIFVHMKISRNAAGQYILGDYSQPYPSVPQMIYHYARTLVPVRGAEYVTLKHPFCRQAV